MTTQTLQINTHGTCTRRQEQTVLLCAQGKHIRDAARVMHISEKTAYRHAEDATERMGAETLPHLISLCWERGYISKAACWVLCWCLYSALNIAATQEAEAIEDDPYRITRTQGNGPRNTWRNRNAARKTEDALPSDEMDIAQLLEDNQQ